MKTQNTCPVSLPENPLDFPCLPHRNDSVSTRNTGYTLVELMIVLTMLGILLSAAVPAYSGFAQSSREMQATTQIQKIAMKLEQHYNTRMSYQAELTALDIPERDSWYQYRIENTHRTQYTIIASPLAGNSSRKIFSLNQHGLQRHRRAASDNWVTGWG